MGRLLAVLIVLITAVSVWLFLDGRWWLPPGITEHTRAYDAQFILTLIIVGISFVLAQPGTDGTDFHSRQASSVDLRPQLVVTTAP
jgi:hypothetical protein